MMQGTHGFLGRRGNCYLGEAPEISHKRAFLAKSVSEEKLRDGPLVFKWPENDIRDFDILQVRRDDGDPQAGSSETDRYGRFVDLLAAIWDQALRGKELHHPIMDRSEERRVGHEYVSTCNSRWW